MHRASSPHGAGRTPTGFTPHSAPQPTISNRNFSRLEFTVTHRKHSPTPKSNRNFRSTNPHGAWGSQFWLRNHNPSTVSCARSTPTQRVTQAGVGLCAVPPALAFPPLTSSRGPFTGRRISLRSCSLLANHPMPPLPPVAAGQRSAPTRQPLPLCREPVAIHPIISNRSTRRLELPETYTKQRTDPLSNRHKFTQCAVTSTPTWSPQHHAQIDGVCYISRCSPDACAGCGRLPPRGHR